MLWTGVPACNTDERSLQSNFQREQSQRTRCYRHVFKMCLAPQTFLFIPGRGVGSTSITETKGKTNEICFFFILKFTVCHSLHRHSKIVSTCTDTVQLSVRAPSQYNCQSVHRHSTTVSPCTVTVHLPVREQSYYNCQSVHAPSQYNCQYMHRHSTIVSTWTVTAQLSIRAPSQ
jgi:hypothetical protein